MATAGWSRSRRPVVVSATAALAACCLTGCGGSQPIGHTASTGTTLRLTTAVASRLRSRGYVVFPLPLTVQFGYRNAAVEPTVITRPLFIPGEPRPTRAFRVIESSSSRTQLRVFVFASTADAHNAVRAGVELLPYDLEFTCLTLACPPENVKLPRQPKPRIAYQGPVVLAAWATPSGAWRRFVAAAAHA